MRAPCMAGASTSLRMAPRAARRSEAAKLRPVYSSPEDLNIGRSYMVVELVDVCRAFTSSFMMLVI